MVLLSGLVFASTVVGTVFAQHVHSATGKDAKLESDLRASYFLKPSYYKDKGQIDVSFVNRIESKISDGSKSKVSGRDELQILGQSDGEGFNKTKTFKSSDNLLKHWTEAGSKTAEVTSEEVEPSLMLARSIWEEDSDGEMRSEMDNFLIKVGEAKMNMQAAKARHRQAKSPRSQSASIKELNRHTEHLAELHRYASLRASDMTNTVRISKNLSGRQFVRQYQRLEEQRAKQYQRLMQQHSFLQKQEQQRPKQSKMTEVKKTTSPRPSNTNTPHNVGNLGSPGGGWKSLRTMERKQAGGRQQRLGDVGGSVNQDGREQSPKNPRRDGGKSVGQGLRLPKTGRKRQ